MVTRKSKAEIARMRQAGRIVAHVVEVVDGDTIVVSIGGPTERVRLIGIDAPEIKHPGKPTQCYGPEAAAREQRSGHLDVAGAEPTDQAGHGARLAAPRLLRHFQERVGGPRHRRDDYDGRLGTMTANDRDGVANGSGIGQ